MSGWVTVTGPPASICFWKIGTTLPEEPRTLPNRTATNRVPPCPRTDCGRPLRDWMYSSANRFAAPMTLLGLTALSVLIRTNACTPAAAAASATTFVPKMLFLIASPGLASIIGTCLWAAQWKTTCGASSAKTRAMRRASQTSATHGRISDPTQVWRSSRSISNRAFSARSTRVSRCGQNRKL